jgi:hypothetical protein
VRALTRRVPPEVKVVGRLYQRKPVILAMKQVLKPRWREKGTVSGARGPRGGRRRAVWGFRDGGTPRYNMLIEDAVLGPDP